PTLFPYPTLFRSELVRARGVREPRPDEQRADLVREQGRQLRSRAGRDEARLHLGEREEREVRILAGDHLDDGAAGGDGDDTRARARGRATSEEDGARVAMRPADDEH